MRFALALLLWPALALATPGPDSVVVVANANVPGSVALAQQYASARDVPAVQVCALDLPAQVDLTLDDYRTLFLEPLRACAAGFHDRIEAALLIRGVPLRVQVPVPEGGTQSVSLAAALALWDSTLADGTSLLGEAPGMSVDCGGAPCYAARWRNPYLAGSFEAGWAMDDGAVSWRPILVTMLHGRSDEDAARLLDSAIAGEGSPPHGTFLFMEGADPARGALDWQIDGAIGDLTALGLEAERVPFGADLEGRTLAGFFTGTASLGRTIEGNAFLPGSLVDNLTSFGALPVNFEPTGESQVSIARWVAVGVAGVHGTVDEPLNNCFPSRQFIVDYAQGATLAEAYAVRMPFVYWRNLVLGDPMAAPYAERPVVTITGLADPLAGAAPIHVEAQAARPLSSLALYLDGVELARSDGAPIDRCFAAPAGMHQLLAVALVAEDPELALPFRPKGWTAIAFTSEGGSTECAMRDAGSVPLDASMLVDGGVARAGGCGCRAAIPAHDAPWVLALFWLLRRRR